MSLPLSRHLEWARALKASAGANARLYSDSRKVSSGDIFFAWPGQSRDARDLVQHALDQGVAAVVAEAEGLTPARWPWSTRSSVLAVQGLKQEAGSIAAAYLDQPSTRMRCFAVTGTNGKTSVTRWLAQACDALGLRSAVVGTLGTGAVANDLNYTGLTTPDAVALQSTLKEFADDGIACVAMEASSIGLQEGRMNGVQLEGIAFTNLSRDHLDYHGDMQAYEHAKLILAKWPQVRFAAVNADDPAGVRFAQVVRGQGAKVLTCGTGDGADVIARAVCLSGSGVSFEAHFNGQKCLAKVPVVGAFNLSNALVVLTLLLGMGVEPQAAVDALAALTPPAGRMQRLGEAGQPTVVVDYAHTPDALENVLRALRPVAQAQQGQLHCLMGCGGDRDPGKRPLMGAAAQSGADCVWVTSDNPRSESPDAIARAILSGMQLNDRVHVELDRAVAIANAVLSLQPQDVIVLAGKGHETTQTIGNEAIPFSDVEHAQGALDAWSARFSAHQNPAKGAA